MLLIKLFSAAVIFIFALVGGLPPLIVSVNKKTKKFLVISDCFAHGIFLGAGLTHLLVDSHRSFQALELNTVYPFATVICAATIVLMLVFEQGIAGTLFSHQRQSDLRTYTLLLMLSFHSVIEGASLGLETHWASFFSLLFAILSHQSSAAFALSVKLRASSLKSKQQFTFMLLCAMATPFGVLLAGYVQQILHVDKALLLEAIFDAIAAGTFIYIAFPIHKDSHVDDVAILVVIKLLCFAIGFSFMALLSRYA